MAKPITHTCVQCGGGFTAYASSNRKYCGRECWAESRRGVSFQPSRKIESRCKQCGKPFLHFPSVTGTFCSKECSVKGTFQAGRKPWNYTLNLVRCKKCGAKFHAPPSAKRKYCAKRCADLARRGTVPHNKQPGHRIKCATCGKRFVVTNARKDTARYCSQQCGADAKALVTGKRHPLWKPKPVRTCQWCGERFEIKPCYATTRYKGQNRGRYCSGECRGYASAAAQSGRQSSIELVVLSELKRRGVKHVAQKKMAKFLVDVYVPERKLVIECDGDYWHSRPHVIEKDRKKDRWLRSHGQEIVRLTETEIREDVRAAVDRALSTPTPVWSP